MWFRSTDNHGNCRKFNLKYFRYILGNNFRISVKAIEHHKRVALKLKNGILSKNYLF